MKEKDMKKVSEFIIEALENPLDIPLLEEIGREVKIFLKKYPIPC